jgi:hypothetical protein
MPRFRNENGVDIQLTPEEETARDAEEAAQEAAKPARAMSHLRTERDSLLASSDWTQYTDSPLTDEVKTSWATYRQRLRDLPETYTADPDAVVWPEAPE